MLMSIINRCRQWRSKWFREFTQYPPLSERCSEHPTIGGVTFVNDGAVQGKVLRIKRRRDRSRTVVSLAVEEGRVEKVVLTDQALAREFRRSIRRGAVVLFSVRIQPGSFVIEDRAEVMSRCELVAYGWSANFRPAGEGSFVRLMLVGAVTQIYPGQFQTIVGLEYPHPEYPDLFVPGRVILRHGAGRSEGDIAVGRIYATRSARLRPSLPHDVPVTR